MIIDLSRPIQTGMPVFPLLPSTYLGVYRSHAETMRPGGVSVTHNILMMSDHAGTHVDATVHFDPKGEGADKIPLDLMHGPAVVQDFSYKRAGESITAGEVERAFQEAGVSPEDVKIVLFRTGADAHWGRPEYNDYYLEVRRDAALWLIERGIKLFGVDAVTVDHARDRATHMLVREVEFYHIENLTNLDALPRSIFTFIGLPLRLEGASAAPLRAAAILPD